MKVSSRDKDPKWNLIKLRYGMVEGSDPLEMGKAYYVYRLMNNLMVYDGEITKVSLQDPLIRKAVAAYFYSLMNGVIITEVVHFGVINSPHYNVLALMATQERYDFEVLDEFDWESSQIKVITDGRSKTWAVSSLTTLHIVTCDEDKVSNTELVTVDKIEDVGDIVVPIQEKPLPPLSGFDVVEIEDPIEENVDLHKDTVIVQNSRIGQSISFFSSPISDVFPLQRYSFYERHQRLKITVNGGVLNCDMSEFSDGFCDEGHMFKCTSTSFVVIIKIEYWWSGSLLKQYDRVNVPYAKKFEEKCKNFFTLLVGELEKLPQGALVQHNLHALKNYVMGYKMPHPYILNQTLNMIGWHWATSAAYVRSKERWMYYQQFVDWRYGVRQFAEGGAVLRSIMSIFDDCSYSYSGMTRTLYASKLESRYDEQWRSSSEGFMPYEKFLVFQKIEYDYENREDRSPRYDPSDVTSFDRDI